MTIHRLLRALAMTCAFITAGKAGATSAAIQRPAISGISHAAFYVSDMAKARAFYEDFLGYQSPYKIPVKGGELIWIKINDRQSVELFPGAAVSPAADRLYHVAVETDDAEAMRLYLRSKGVAVPDKTPVGKIGNKNFFIQDPAGNTIEIVEYTPESWTVREKGKFLPPGRVATRMSHVGVMVGQLDASLAFYRDILGFQETWRGARENAQTVSWVNLQVPNGTDYIEFMLYDTYPSPGNVRVLQHICLEVDDIVKAGALLGARKLPAGSKPPTAMKAGVNGRRQINYFDPDGTRIEVMEPGTFDGKVRPPSTLPAPVGAPRPVPAAG